MSCKTVNTCYTGTVDRFDEYKLEQSVAVKAISELTVGEAGWWLTFSTKLHPRFAYLRPDNIKMYKLLKQITVASVLFVNL